MTSVPTGESDTTLAAPAAAAGGAPPAARPAATQNPVNPAREAWYARLMRSCLASCVAAFVLFAQPAAAKSHLWKFTEVFSNASGSVQFIEMFVFDPAGTAETQLKNFPLTSNSHTFIFPNNLPAQNTFHTWILIATPAFAALPGAPVPDFIIPANFFDPAGDELRYRTILDILPLPAGALPVDGIHSRLRDGTTAVNSPTNFAGVEGSIDVSTPCVDGIDNDGDGAIDFGIDPGCASADDPDHSELDTTGAFPCDDGTDNDADGYIDFPEDPACFDPSWPREQAQCQDGVNNDGLVGTDFDAGESILGVGAGDPAGPDPQCLGKPWRNLERVSSCGLGYEISFALVGLRLLQRRRRGSAG